MQWPDVRLGEVCFPTALWFNVKATEVLMRAFSISNYMHSEMLTQNTCEFFIRNVDLHGMNHRDYMMECDNTCTHSSNSTISSKYFTHTFRHYFSLSRNLLMIYCSSGTFQLVFYGKIYTDSIGKKFVIS